MKRTYRISVVLAVLAAGIVAGAWASPASAAEGQKKPTPEEAKARAEKLLADAKQVFAPLPEKMPGSEKDSEAKIALGRKLYFEKAISINNTQSCNDCHRVDEGRGGVDNLPTSKGAEGKFGGRNAPTTLNAGLHVAQFWDGRAPDLAAQAKGPVLNPIEMGMSDEAAVLARLKDAGYEPQFKAVFPDCDKPLTYDNYAEAVAAFERTLITRDRFDDFLGGNLDALNGREKAGLATFLRTGCADCHQGALLGGTEYEKMGQANAYANTEDVGRFEVTKKDADKFVFKVPSLRNICLTGPYFHDGKSATLADAVKQMAWLQVGDELTDQQVESIVAFLGSLTDKQRGGARKTAQN
jgi:cytochrome c peroxidase